MTSRSSARLLVVEARGERLHDRAVAELPELLAPSDLVVLNDAATLPASLRGRANDGAAEIEVRLAGPPRADGTWPAVLFGAGDWRTRTEDRPPPPRLEPGARVELGAGALAARVTGVSAISPRLVDLRFDREGEALWEALYRHGRPVQYAHTTAPYDLWTVQTAYAGRPWAVEMPSAGRPLDWRTLGALRRRGVELVWLTHAAGLSSTGDPALDAALPLPEAFDIPAATAAAVRRARSSGRRVIAVGTTVVRALEGAARASHSGWPEPGPGATDLVLGPDSRLRVVDGILTGIHAPGESHFRLLGAFAPATALEAASRHAAEAGYLPHELGDLCLIVPSIAAEVRDARAAGAAHTCGVRAGGSSLGAPGADGSCSGGSSRGGAAGRGSWTGTSSGGGSFGCGAAGCGSSIGSLGSFGSFGMPAD